MEGCTKWTVTQNETSLKWNVTQNGMSLKMECHSKKNATKKMSLQMEYQSK